MTMPSTWQSVVRVETTVQETRDRESGARGRAVFLKPDREFDSTDTWMFVDGSSKGWSGLVVMRPGEDVRLVARDSHTPMKNIGAEMDAFLMALDATAPGERVAIVADLLWSIYYVLGWYNVSHEALRAQVEVARALLDARRPESLRFIHVKGHVKDTTAFGRWNHVADQLCSLCRPVDVTLPMSAFGEAGARARPLAAILAAAERSRA